MEHTVKGYLSQLSTARLREFLRQYAAGEMNEDFSYIIPYAQAELYRRESPVNAKQFTLPDSLSDSDLHE